ncbi:MAG: Trk system potassium transporter TrkA [Thermoguttaceae bacterium]|nr:Trk system potassium transporter TrkA [Thermoguttaceae bacterium]
MRVLVLGGGDVGGSVARLLCEQRHEVTVVERDPERAAWLDDELDARVLCGVASQAGLLFQAGATTADVCLALTGDDETNLLAGSVAKAMGARRSTARVYAPFYRDVDAFDYRRHLGLDRLLDVEFLTAMELARRIREPGAMLIEHFIGGELEMQDVLIAKPSASTGRPLSELRLPSEVRVAAINREGAVSIASANDRVEVGDRVTLLGERAQVENVKKLFQTQSAVKRNVVVAGGGETGLSVAAVLEKRNYNVKILDSRRERCEFLARRLTKTTVVFGDARRRDVLAEQRVGNADVFIACAGGDEDNIMACVEAGELGAKFLAAVVEQPDYANVVGKLGIDEVVSPYEVIGRQVEGLMHTGALVFQNSRLLAGSIDVLELEVEADSPATRLPLKDLELPKPSLIAAVIRENAVLAPNATFVFRPGDAVLALCDARNVATFVPTFERD